jgi:hypothetical protein
MKDLFKWLLALTPLYRPIRDRLYWRRQNRELEAWNRGGRTSYPPEKAKQNVLKEYALRYDLKVFVETGTFMGDTVEAMKNVVDRIYSIELSRELFEQARERFRAYDHVELIHGDSANVLRHVIAELNQPALFWLDGHLCGGITASGEKETPIHEELEQILCAPDPGHVMIIDDARCFGDDPAYPTIEELTEYILSRRPGVDIVVEGDSIRITPKGNTGK